MQPAWWGNILLLAAVSAAFTACKPDTFSYEISGDVTPSVLALPAADGAISPVVAYQDEKGIRTDFMADEVVISPGSQEELNSFLSEYGGIILGDNSVPEPPAFLKSRVTVSKEDLLPTSYTVRVTSFPDTGNLARDATRRGVEGKFLFSSEEGVKLMALVSREKARGLKIHPNFVFIGHEMLHRTQEQPVGAGFDNAMNYFAFHGEEKPESSRSSIYKAWQFMEAAGYVAPQWYGLAILDGGFWLNAAGGPMQSPVGIGTDLPSQIVQYDFHEDDFIASGENPNVCSGGGSCPWHGNSSASVAAGFLNNQAAIAGSGGQVSQPFLFKLRLTSDQQDRAIRTAISWGAEVVNMSFGGACNGDCMEYKADAGLFDHFQQAYDAGIILVASAGNDAIDVDANNVLPCCIGGVICVGALDSYNFNAISYSNFGASVDIWADTNIPAMPNGGSPNALTTAGGTSASSPLVAGVAMMMKRIDPALNSDHIKGILQDTAFKMGAFQSTDPKVSPVGYMDAYRAVMRAADNRIAEDSFEPNNAEGQASPLNPGHHEELTLNPGQWDYYSFSLSDYGSIDFNLEYMTPMGFVFFNLIPGTPGAVLGGVSKSAHGEGYHYGATLVPPGNYKLLLSANNPHYYYMDFSKTEGGLLPDEFEVNNTFATATNFLTQSGSRNLTLHEAGGSDVDYILIEISPMVAFIGREYNILDADSPLKVDVLDAATQAVIESYAGNEVKLLFTHESVGSKYVLKIHDAYTRYVFEVRSKRLDHYWEETLPYDPFWWEDPLGPDIRNILREVEDWIAFVALPRGVDNVNLFAEGLGVNLFNEEVQLLQSGAPIYEETVVGAKADGVKIGERLDTSALTAGETYLLQVYRIAEPQNEEVTGVTSVRDSIPYVLESQFAP